MKKNIQMLMLLLTAFSFINEVSAQIIRKNYREMTTMEKQLLVDALNAVGPRVPAPGTNTVISLYAGNHTDLTNALSNTSIHQVNDFLPWHRWFILYFEKELQNTSVTGADKITIPYWDWTSKYYGTSPNDRDKAAPLWVQSGNLLFQFNTAWSLGRLPSSSTVLGTETQVGEALLNTNFTTFRNQLEGWTNPIRLHNAGHVWVGGVMQQNGSPGDPAFFLHHCMVDKIWQDWQNLGRISNFTDEILPNKGTSSASNFPTGSALTIPAPDVQPSTIVDGRASSVKVWYAENGKVILDKYTVNGTENYRYTGIIEAGSRVATSTVINGTTVNYSTGNFTVPSGTVCNFVSGGLQMGTSPTAGYIRLVPGFKADLGSSFTAKINSAYFTDPAAGGKIVFENFTERETSKEKIDAFPNPSRGVFNITLLDNSRSFTYTVSNPFGVVVLTGESDNQYQMIDLSAASRGVYVLTLTTAEGKVYTKRLVVN